MDPDSCFRFGFIVLAAAILFFMINEYSKTTKKANSEKFDDKKTPERRVTFKSNDSVNPEYEKINAGALSATPKTPEPTASEELAAPQASADCFPRDKLSAEELLPKDAANTKWSQANPAGQGNVGDQNFLNAGFHVGINTVGNSLRNPNYQLRSEPPNPQTKVGPWMMSTIAPDLNRRPLEIGEA